MLSINNNLSALRVSHNLDRHYSALATSTQRLSTGLRINSAADDAAGLAIRELQRADIAALQQGTRNANDAISLIQTADGALSVIDEKLIRMKELSEQAATGTYTSTQRLMIDSEFKAMAAEIDRIANATDFNGIKLLDGSLNGKHDGSGLTSTGAMKIHFGSGNDSAEDYYYINIGDCTLKGLGLADVISTPETIELSEIDPYDLDAYLTGTGTITTYYLVKKVNVLSYYDFYTEDTFENGVLVNTRAYQIYNGKEYEIYWDESMSKLDNHTFYITYTGDSPNDTMAGIPFTLYTISNQCMRNQYSNSGDPNTYIYSDFQYCRESTGLTRLYYIINNGIRTEIENVNISGNTITYNIVGYSVINSFEFDTTSSNLLERQKSIIYNTPGFSSPVLPLNLDMKKTTVIPAESTTEVHGIETQEKAQNMLVQIDNAIVSKDNIRAHLGALQNRLENTVSNLTIQSENLQAAESRISDIDVATEMTNFVRNQILTQSAVAMLSQANSLPQMALQLIQ